MTVGNLQQRIQHIEHTIQEACDRTGRKRTEVMVVAVTKQVSAKRAGEVLAEGIHDLGKTVPRDCLENSRKYQKVPFGISSGTSKAGK